MLTRNQIKSALKENDIRIRKRLGQNFLVNRKIQEKIVDALGISKGDTVIEIGPGLGALTGELTKRAKRVIAIEKDRRLYDFLLKKRSMDDPGNLELIHGDILKHRFDCRESRKLKVVGNLPYYISSPILIRLLTERRCVDTIFITVQKEFAERLVARAGSKAYGAITCFVQFYSKPSFLFTIERSSFYPVPKVDSCFLRIDIYNDGLYLTDEEKLFKIIRACFGKRRKKILNSLYSSNEFASKEEVLEKLEIAGIAPERRPETVFLEEFVKLTNSV
ncbi:MAG: ribosomal RNA small subunit methyltransferase A [Candidatus Omnitrophica bacterium]|nr:ribosomal RNA small subunit methyltransferase A [Candidatus Omnitrophota bacterium]